MNVLPGRNFGGEFGNSLAQGLQQLAQHKINENLQHKQRQEASRLWKSLGVPDKEAYAFASAPESVQKSLLDRLEGASFGGQPQNQYNQGQAQQAQQMQPELDQQGQPMAQGNQGGFTLGPTKEERRHREIIGLKREVAEKKEVADKYKATKEARHEIVEKAKSARQTMHDLDRLEELQKTGKLDTPGYTEFLKRSGLDIPALLNPESEEFQKIQQGFLKNAKQYFGGRISNYEVEQFLKTIPSLSQSPEGRKRVIAGIRNISRADFEYNNALKEVLAENKGIPPYDLEEKVYEKVEKKLDSLSKMFKHDLSKPVPKGQNKYVTALQAGLGSVVGAPGAILSGAGKGAASIMSVLA